MKKRILSIIFVMLASICILVGFSSHNAPVVYAEPSLSPLDLYDETIREINDLTQYEIIFVSKISDTIEDAISVEDNNGEIVVNYDYSWLVEEIKAISFNNLTYDRLADICSRYDYSVRDKRDYYELYSNYCLKSLIVTGELNGETYGAIKVASYNGRSTLLFASEEQTRLVYGYLKTVPSLTVEINVLVWLDEAEIVEGVQAASSSYTFNGRAYLSWGAEAMDINPYREYLSSIPTDRQVVVAVLDSGINTSHELFTNRLITNGGSVVGKSYYTSQYTYSGYTFEDDCGHGSHVSGIVCDLTPSNVKILPIKVLGSDGKGSYSNIVAGMNRVVAYADTYTIACCNMSLGGSTEGSTPTEIMTAINNMLAKNVLTVVAAGNETDNTENHYPACISNAITVGNVGIVREKFRSLTSIQYDNVRYTDGTVESYWESSFPAGNTEYRRHYSSNYGTAVDISAPGTLINSAYIGSSKTSPSPSVYAQNTGTSMAAPHISALVSMICLDSIYYNSAGNATYTATDIEDRLKTMTERKKSNENPTLVVNSTNSLATWSNCFGVGLANIKYYADITYTATDTSVTYDGQYHNISVTNIRSTEGTSFTYTITYGFSSNNCTISNISTNTNFKNATGTSGKTVYFKIDGGALGVVVGSAKLTILPRTITISFNASGYYGNTPTVTSYSIISGGIGETPTITLGGISSTTGVGTYTVSSASTTDQNYSIVLSSCSYTVNRRPVTIKINDFSIEYGSIPTADNGYTVTSGSVVNGDRLVINATLPTSVLSVGNHSITASPSSTISPNSNYNISVIAGTLCVTAKTISATLENQSGIYGNSISLDQTKYSLSSGVQASQLGSIQITTSASRTSGVGQYLLSISCSNSNYILTAGNTAYYIILARKLQIVADNQSSICGEHISVNGSKYSISKDTADTSEGRVNADSISITLSTSATSTSGVGAYPITATTTNPNYYISVKSGKYMITARPITIQLNNNYGTYGDTPLLGSQSYTVTNQGYSLLSWDKNLNLTTTTSATNTSAVGEYPLTGSASNNNYFVTVLAGKYIVQKRSITITPSTQTGEYGDDVTLNQTAYTVSGLALFDEKSVLGTTLSTGASSISPVGEYIISAAISNSNYQLSNTPSGTFAVTARAITIKIDNQQGYYGATPNLIAGYEVTSSKKIVNGDNIGLSVSTLATNTSGVGEYDISGTTSNDNYSVTITKGKYTVVAKPINVTLHNQTGEYGEIIALDNAKYAVSQSGAVVNADNLEIVLQTTATNLSVPSDYPITIKSNNPNYSITATPSNYTVTKRVITITPNDCVGEYGHEPILDSGYTLSKPVVNNDSLNVCLSTTATSSSPKGKYPITATASHEYYVLNFLQGVYTVGGRVLRVTILAQSGVYGDNHVLDSTQYTIPSGVIAEGEIVPIELNFADELTTQSPVGGYDIVASTSNDNYSVVTVSGAGKYIIKAKEIQLTIEEQTGVYGSVSIDSTKFSVSGLVGTDTKQDLNITLSTPATNKSGANKTYNINVSSTNTNYKFAYDGSKKYKILPKDIVIDLSSQSGIYGNAPSLSAGYSAVSGVILNGDSLNLQLGTSATSTSGVGVYDLYVVSNNANYNITNCNGSGKYEVTPRPVTIKIYQYFNIGDAIVFDTTSSGYTVTSGSVVNNDDLQLTITASVSTRENSGEYTDVSVDCANANYDLTIASAKYKISSKIIVVKVSGSMIYGNQPSTATYTYEVIEGKVSAGDEIGFTFHTSATNKSSVGTSYTITEQHTNSNYTITLRDCVFEVKPRILTIAVENQSGEFGSIHSVSQAYNTQNGEVIEGDSVNVILSINGISGIRTSVGEYAITGKSTNKNYSVVVTSGKYVVTPREIELTISNQAGVYGEEVNLDHSKFIAQRQLSGDELNIRLKTVATSASTVGEYAIELDSFDNSNYTIVGTTNGIFTVTAKPISVSVNPNGIYGNSIGLSNSVYSVEGIQLVGTDKLDLILTTTATSTANAGEYPVSVLSCNPNYSVDLGDSKFTIIPRAITVALGNQTKVYGEAVSLDNVYTTSGALDRDADKLNIQLSTNATKLSPIGDYIIDATCGNSNYTATITKASYTITARPVEITPNNVRSVYGDAISIDHSNYAITSGTQITGDNLGITLLVDFDEYSAGEYDISAESSNGNYAIAVKQGVWSIVPRKVSIGIVGRGTYGNVDLSNCTYQSISGSVVDGDDLNLQLNTSATNASPAGEYELDILSNNPNYEVTVVSAKYVVSPKEIAIQLQPQSSVYGDDIVLDQNAYIFDNSQLVNGDTLTFVIVTDAQPNNQVGQYNLYIGANNDNYVLDITSAKYSITRRELAIKVNGTIEYGDSLDLSNPQYIHILSGSLVNDDALNLRVHCSAQNTLTLGIFPITLLDCNDNYDVQLEDSFVSIVAKKLAISVQQSFEYGNEITLDQAGYTLNHSPIGNDVLGVVLSTSVNSQTSVGVYNVAISHSNTNYELEVATSVVQITPRRLSVKVSNASGIYGNAISLSGVSYRINSGRIVNNDQLNIHYTTTATDTSDVGEYPITAVTSNANYDLRSIAGVYTVNKRKLKIKLNNQSTFRGVMYKLDHDDYEILEGEVVDDPVIKQKSTGKRFYLPGTYELYGVCENANYEVEFVNAELKLHMSVFDYVLIAGLLGLIVLGIIAAKKSKQRRQKVKEELAKWDDIINW